MLPQSPISMLRGTFRSYGEASLEGGDTADLIARLNEALADRYRLVREIGAGGMATVFLADDRRHSRKVAIKVLEPKLVGLLTGDRFHREIEVVASLNHPLILPLYDSGEAAGCLYYVMPFVEGESLRDRLGGRSQLPLEEIVRIAVDVTEALVYAHEHGVIHRDIKPGNILVSSGRAVLADFGIAQAITAAGGESLTTSGVLMGTPRYMSPEQVAGEPVDGRSDLYALGCVLHEMIVGDPPFPARQPHVAAAQQLGATPTPIRTLRPAMPEWLERVVTRLLQKAPADRFDSAADLLEAIRAGRRGRLIERTAPRAWVRGAAAVALVTAAVAVGLVVRDLVFSSSPPLSAERIVVFPLEDFVDADAGRGEQVAIMAGYMLEDTQPLRWLEGRDWLEPELRRGASPISVERMTALSRDRGARYFIDGSVMETLDSVAVILRLHDVEEGSVVARARASDPLATASFGNLGIRAINQLIPHVIETGRQIDRSALEARHPAAVANWLLGEVAYRRSRFDDALEHFERALVQDSALGYAALGAAKAAAWREQESANAEAWVARARAYEDQLPARYALFARGLESYLTGRAEAALAQLDSALALEPAWSEAWMTRGEVFRHLLTSSLGPDSLAAASYRAALAADAEFSPALSHLAEFALGQGRIEDGRALLERFARVDPDTRFIDYLRMSEECLRVGASSMDWGARAAANAFRVLQAGITLAGPLDSLDCAEGAYRAVQRAPDADEPTRWGALVGLQTLLLARGGFDEIPAQLDANAYGFLLYPFAQVVAGAFDQRARAAVERLGTDYEELDAPVLWAIGLWAFHNERLDVLGAVRQVVRTRSAAGAGPVVSEIAAQLDAYDDLARGRDDEAIVALAALEPVARKRSLLWDQWASLGLERLWLARLYFERGDLVRADSVARLLEHPQPISYLAVRPEALALRAAIADSLGDPERAAVYRGLRDALRP